MNQLFTTDLSERSREDVLSDMKHTRTSTLEKTTMTNQNAKKAAKLTRIAGVLVVTVVAGMTILTLIARQNAEHVKSRGSLSVDGEILSADGFAQLSEFIHEQRALEQARLRSWVKQVNREHHDRNQHALVDFETELVAVVGSRVDQAHAAVPQTVQECTADGFFQMLKDTTFKENEFNARVLGVVESNVFPYMTLAQSGGVVALQRLQQRLEENHGVLLATLASGAPREVDDVELRNILAENVKQVKTGDIISEQMRSMKIHLTFGALVPAVFWKYEARQFKALWQVARRLAVAGARKIARRSTIAIGISFIDGPAPFFDALGALVTGYAVYEMVSEWNAMKKKIPAQIDRNLHETLNTYEKSLYWYFHGLAVESYEVAQRRQGELESKTMARLNQE